jgi:hypothetical protein
MSLDINLTGVEKTSNKKTNLTDNSDTFYPTQKAVKTALDLKVDKVTGKGLSANDFTNTLKTKLDGIQDGAEVNVNADWNATSGDAQILNKPTIPSITGLVPYTGATQNVDLGEYELKAGQVEFDQTPTGTAGVAVMRWNDTDGTVDLGLKGGNVTLQLGQEQLVRVVNKTATNINLLEANYQAVRVTGAQGQRLKVDLAQATNDVLSAETIGLVTETINNNQEGFITTSGLVRGINTTGSLQGETWADGDVVYLSSTTAGRITNVKPSAPNHLVIIGYVVSAHATQGSIFVKVDNGYKLDELHNVAISSVANNQSLVYETASTLWKNKALTASDVGAVETNSPITAGTYHKVTVDTKGLVTSGSVSYQMLFGNPNLSIGGSLTRHFSFSEGIASNSAINRYIPFIQDVTVSRLFITTITAQPSGGSSVFTIQKNGVDTGIVITIPAGSSAGSYSEIVTTASFNAGDNISIKWVNNSASTSCVVAGVSIGFL